MNALDLRADHPELLRNYTPTSKRRVGTGVTKRVAGAFRRLVATARLKPVAAQ